MSLFCIFIIVCYLLIFKCLKFHPQFYVKFYTVVSINYLIIIIIRIFYRYFFIKFPVKIFKTYPLCILSITVFILP